MFFTRVVLIVAVRGRIKELVKHVVAVRGRIKELVKHVVEVRGRIKEPAKGAAAARNLSHEKGVYVCVGVGAFLTVSHLSDVCHWYQIEAHYSYLNSELCTDFKDKPTNF